MYIKLEEGLYLIGSGLYGLSCWKDCSVYLFTDRDESAIVDAGAGIDTERLIRNFEETGIDARSVRYLLLTHAHGDHAGGMKDFRAYFTNAQIITSKKEAYLMAKGSEQELGLDLAKEKGAYPNDYVYNHVEADRIVKDGDVLLLGNSVITTYLAAGHTEESVLYYFSRKGKKYLFCGDYIFLRGIIGLLNAPGSSLAGFRKSLPIVSKLKIDALLPGHREFALENAQRFLDMALKNIKTTTLPPVM